MEQDEDGDLVLPRRPANKLREKHRWSLAAAKTKLFEAIKLNDKDGVLRELLSCPVDRAEELLNSRDSPRQ